MRFWRNFKVEKNKIINQTKTHTHKMCIHIKTMCRHTHTHKLSFNKKKNKKK